MSMNRSLALTFFACSMAQLLLAQPAEWTPTPTNAAGTLLGTVTVGGQAAQAGDWVAALSLIHI